MQLLQDLDKLQLRQYISQFDSRRYVSDQVYEWLNKGKSFDEMSNVSLKTRGILKENSIAQCVTIERVFKSSIDGTQKYLYRLSDGNLIEGVLMSYKYGNTLCVSTQVGCRMGCKFCASTLGGLVRNLSAGEILGQVVAVNSSVQSEKRYVTNIVLMGSGEPLDNYQNVTKFLRLVSSPDGLNISQRNISLSTCGLVPQIKQLADDGVAVNLTVSLHNASQAGRERIMPISKKYSVAEVIDAAKYYFEKTGRRVIFEYTLISDENDSYGDALMLANLVKGFPSHVNLIRLNKVKETNLKSVDEARAQKFCGYLLKLNVSATLRRQMGADIEGACGQLRRKYIGEAEN
ncbi:MAG: 23S rRNA (adenine(2503)-C(2))-methyltransferase RlmN [Corallococcus sp.]|nr:23S rRNA (adenine(2503)-C(2))-methyltransferase RlmN [Corallococcus sp.]